MQETASKLLVCLLKTMLTSVITMFQLRNEHVGNSLTPTDTRPRKCDYFEWKDVALEDGYYKNLIYSMKQQLDSKEDLGVIKNLRTKNVELEFLLSKEKSLVASMEKGMCDSKKSIRMYKLLVVVLIVGYLMFVLF
ncbi:unnamed protein product [Lactuca virosa]|uniref:Uncharacterized protein n=1 Tax=Lactuca virosa TaxID=75947 RepID=A0AAU9P4M8_9ASTR|nr:unnamed protein product [Lactuca virosa]